MYAPLRCTLPCCLLYPKSYKELGCFGNSNRYDRADEDVEAGGFGISKILTSVGVSSSPQVCIRNVSRSFSLGLFEQLRGSFLPALRLVKGVNTRTDFCSCIDWSQVAIIVFKWER